MFDDGGGFSLFFAVSILAPILTLGLIVLGIVAISKADFDPTGRRPYAFYLYAVCFISLFTLVFSAAATVSSASRFVGDDSLPSAIRFSDYNSDNSSSSYSSSGRPSSGVTGTIYDPATGRPYRDQGQSTTLDETPETPETPETTKTAKDERRDEIARDTVQVGFVALLSLLIFAFHWSRAQKMVREAGFTGTPASRVHSSYLYAVCFVTVVVILVAGSIAAYAAFRVGFPEITATFDKAEKVEREAGWRELASSGVILVIAGILAVIHWRQIYRPPAGTTPPQYAPPSG